MTSTSPLSLTPVMPIITLLTDFTDADGYVAAMKGVVLSISPQARLVDVSHRVPPQDIHAGAFILGTAYRYFSSETVHVAVVDPGVGSKRRAILLETPRGRFLAPDNGLLTYVLADAGLTLEGPGAVPPEPALLPLPAEVHAFALENQGLFLPSVSNTFHGRDIFAPVAARLVAGLPSHDVGPSISALQALKVPVPVRHPDGRIIGRIIHVDAFGNLITNLREQDLPRGRFRIVTGGKTIATLSTSYQGGSGLLAISGSSGRIEIAARDRSAWAVLGLGRWSEVTVLPG